MVRLGRRNVLAGGGKMIIGLTALGFSAKPFGAVRAAEGTLAKAVQTQLIRVGIANEKPYGYVDSNGKPTGAIVEVLRAALAPIGINKVEGNIVDFDALIPGLNADRFDVIGAGMYIRPARCKAIAFSNPVTRSGGAFIAKKGNPKGVHSLKEVAAKPDVKIGTQTGSSQVEEVKQAGIAPAQVVLFAKDTEAVAGLQAGRIDIVYFPDLEVNTLLETANDPTLERVAPYEQILDQNGKPSWNYQALGLRKSDADLVAALNKEIAGLLSSGKLLQILQPYGYSQNELPPPDVSAASLCNA
jgi:polar amino acid transport system substrate-binding protein